MKFAKKVLVIVGTLAAVISSGALDAAAEDALNVLVFCVNPGGMPRIVSEETLCRKQEVRVGFNDLPNLVALREKVAELEKRLEAVENCTSPDVCPRIN